MALPPTPSPLYFRPWPASAAMEPAISGNRRPSRPRTPPSTAVFDVQEDTLYCLVILPMLCIFASVTSILGYYGSVELVVGPGCSRLLGASSVFVQDVEVRVEEGSGGSGLVLYGFPEAPPLDVLAAWSETRRVAVPAGAHREWAYYLNKGAQIEIAYSVKSERSYPLSLIIAEGKDGLAQWLESPLFPNTTLSWNLVHGTGTIRQVVSLSSDYYIVVGNLNEQNMMVLLDFRVTTLFYNTTGANYRCSLDGTLCTYRLPFLGHNVAVLSSGLTETNSDEQYVKLSYGPRWVVYIVGSGVVTVAVVLVYKILNALLFNTGIGDDTTSGQPPSDTGHQRTPLLTNKDGDNASLGSSYESVSHDEEDADGSALNNGESSHLCAVCCDARRDCFFLPCGHSATCYACGTRVLEGDGNCPFCRRRLKKVRRIFTV